MTLMHLGIQHRLGKALKEQVRLEELKASRDQVLVVSQQSWHIQIMEGRPSREFTSVMVSDLHSRSQANRHHLPGPVALRTTQPLSRTSTTATQSVLKNAKLQLIAQSTHEEAKIHRKEGLVLTAPKE